MDGWIFGNNLCKHTLKYSANKNIGTTIKQINNLDIDGFTNLWSVLKQFAVIPYKQKYEKYGVKIENKMWLICFA